MFQFIHAADIHLDSPLRGLEQYQGAPVEEIRGATQRALLPPLCYFTIVFSAGFLLGPIRVFWLEPRIGSTLATACEMPLLTGVMFAAARWLPARLAMDAAVRPLIFMGLGALALALLADFAVGAFIRGVSPAAQLANLTTPAGLIYVVSLAVFAAMPLLANRWRKAL